MDETSDTPDESEEATMDTQATDLAPPAAPAVVEVAVETPPVDNSGGETAPDEPMQELPDSELPPEIRPGAMGADRVLLMQLLRLDVNHAFDEEAEDQIRRRAADYDGVVTKAIWRELFKEDPAIV